MKNEKWKMQWAFKTGHRNNCRKMLCQDRMSYKEAGSLQVIAQADGNSRDNICVVGLEKILDSLCCFILDYYDEIIGKMEQKRDEDVKEMIMNNIEMEIDSLLQNYPAAKRDFASTISAVCIDTKMKYFFAMHLGDGIIICKKDEKYYILSNNIIQPKVYLTTSPEARKQMKVFYDNLDSITDFILMTKGVFEIPLSVKVNEKQQSLLETVEDTVKSVSRASNIFLEKMNDQSLIMLYKEGHHGKKGRNQEFSAGESGKI